MGNSADLTPYFTYMDGNRKHQKDALNAIRNNSKGQIILPTGTGKSRIQVCTILEEVAQGYIERKPVVAGITAHRILLCSQLLKTISNVIIKSCHVPMNILIVNSGRQDKEYYEIIGRMAGFSCKIEEGTSREMINNFYSTSMKEGRNLLIVSTYHSLNRTSDVPYNLICHDEAHMLTQEDFMENRSNLNIKREYFFTATRKINSENGGMNNEEVFGDIIFSESPAEMLKRSEIVHPMIHLVSPQDVMDFDTTDINDSNMLFKVIKDCFIKHRNKIKEDSFNSDSIGAKMLITCRGSEQLNNIHDSELFREWCKDNNIKVYAVSSNEGEHVEFNKLTGSNNRADFLIGLNSLDDRDDAIILHIDILAEGLDLPAITGVLSFRELGDNKLIQTVGRATRLFKEDRKRLYSGEISYQDIKRHKFIKPFCWIIVPTHLFTTQEFEHRANEVIKRLRTEYKVVEEEIIFNESFASLDNGLENDPLSSFESSHEGEDFPIIHSLEGVDEVFDEIMGDIEVYDRLYE